MSITYILNVVRLSVIKMNINKSMMPYCRKIINVKIHKLLGGLGSQEAYELWGRCYECKWNYSKQHEALNNQCLESGPEQRKEAEEDRRGRGCSALDDQGKSCQRRWALLWVLEDGWDLNSGRAGGEGAPRIRTEGTKAERVWKFKMSWGHWRDGNRKFTSGPGERGACENQLRPDSGRFNISG